MSLSDSYPVQLVCSGLGLSRSSYYYQPQQRDEAALKDELKKIAGEFVKYGSRRLREQLKRSGYLVGRERVRRLMREINIEIKPSKKPNPKTTDSDHPHSGVQNLVQGLEIVRPEQVWVADILVRKRQSIAIGAKGGARLGNKELPLCNVGSRRSCHAQMIVSLQIINPGFVAAAFPLG